jgi:integrase
VSLVKRFFRWCVTRGHHLTRLTVDPTANITKPADEVKRDRVLSDYEVKLFLMALRKEGQAFAVPMKLLLLTGARRSEVFEASWTEFDMATGDWLLPSSRSKNKLAHLLPLPEAATALIESIPNRERSPLLFASQRTATKAVSGISKMVARIRERMETLAARDGRQIQHWQIHDLRRTVATGMAGLMIHPHEIEAVLNHVSGARAGVAGIYNRHAYRVEKKRALEIWAEKISDLEKQIADW